MRKIKFFIALMLVLFSIVGCGKKSEINSADLALSLNSDVTFGEQLTEIDSSAAQRRYGISSKDYENIISFVGTKGTCDEFVIIKTSDTDKITEKLDAYLTLKQTEYNDYRPYEAQKLATPIIERHKDCVTMIITADYENALNVYRNYLKK